MDGGRRKGHLLSTVKFLGAGCTAYTRVLASFAYSFYTCALDLVHIYPSTPAFLEDVSIEYEPGKIPIERIDFAHASYWSSSEPCISLSPDWNTDVCGEIWSSCYSDCSTQVGGYG
jgi:hypothetical protein